MKPEIIKTKSKKLVLQVYHNYFLYHKDMKAYSDRKEYTKWKNEINSKSGQLKGEKLILSKSDYNPSLLNCDLIILNDFNSNSEAEIIKNQSQKWQNNLINFEEKKDQKVWAKINNIQYMSLTGSQRKFEIFQLKKENNQIELHLLYDLFEIGEPKRENFKLCNLKLNTPIEIKINGKLDHSYSKGRERTYKEHCYIFHLLGECNEFELVRTPFKCLKKQIPTPIKTIDLMKELY